MTGLTFMSSGLGYGASWLAKAHHRVVIQSCNSGYLSPKSIYAELLRKSLTKTAKTPGRIQKVDTPIWDINTPMVQIMEDDVDLLLRSVQGFGKMK